MSHLTRRVTCIIVALVAACGDDVEPPATKDGGAVIPWDQGGPDTAEYSLGRLLIAHEGSSRLTVLDLDSESVAGHLDGTEESRPFTSNSGRYAFVVEPATSLLRVVDPGQWLLSHLDHFHIAKSALEFRAEQVPAAAVSSLTSNDGWIALFDASTGRATVFQERSITAKAFAPSSYTTSPHAGVALVSRAHLFVSEQDGAKGAGIAVRDALAMDNRIHFAAPCSTPAEIASDGKTVFIGCSEGALALTWNEGSLAESREPALSLRDHRPFVRTSAELGAVLYLRSAQTLALWRPGQNAQLFELPAEIVDVQVRRQNTAAIALTSDGQVHELDLSTSTLSRATQVIEAFDANTVQPRFVLSHAYAYVIDPRTPKVYAVRLRTMQLESTLAVEASPSDIALVGVPANYTDERE